MDRRVAALFAMTLLAGSFCFQLVLPTDAMHKSKSVIASAAKQSIFARQSTTDGSPRRCASRDDVLMQTFPSSF
jgi:hypothetical protein